MLSSWFRFEHQPFSDGFGACGPLNEAEIRLILLANTIIQHPAIGFND